MDTAIKTTTRDTTDTTTEPSLTFEQMYSDCWQYCRGIAKWKVRGINSHTVDDLVSDAYERLYRKWATVDGQPAKVQKTYLGRIVANRVNDYLRRLKLERDTFMPISEGVTNTEAGDYSGNKDGGFDTDSLSIQVYRASGDTFETLSPEHIYLAREELDEVKCHLYRSTTGGKRMYQNMLLQANGYSTTEIAAAQDRTPSAVKMDLMRAREYIGIPKQARYRTMEGAA